MLPRENQPPSKGSTRAQPFSEKSEGRLVCLADHLRLGDGKVPKIFYGGNFFQEN
jgi:hypothetical protein